MKLIISFDELSTSPEKAVEAFIGTVEGTISHLSSNKTIEISGDVHAITTATSLSIDGKPIVKH